jgi:hypothetical protein
MVCTAGVRKKCTYARCTNGDGVISFFKQVVFTRTGSDNCRISEMFPEHALLLSPVPAGVSLRVTSCFKDHMHSVLSLEI